MDPRQCSNYDGEMSSVNANNSIRRLLGATAVVVLGSLLAGSFFQTCLSERELATAFMHEQTWLTLITKGHPSVNPGIVPETANVSFASVYVPIIVVTLAIWLGGATWLAWRRGMNWIDALISWGWYGWIWWYVLDAWEWLRIVAAVAGLSNAYSLLSATPQMWLAGCLACWLTTWFTLGCSIRVANSGETQPSEIKGVDSVRQVTVGSMTSSDLNPRCVYRLWLACGIYAVVFTTMNWRLYFNLFVPHGDSAMYEEHLWNLLHGKGFRSYLDQGLFFGEHIQFVHLFLIPLYLIWPSHLMLEACSSTALACGAFPVYWMARRHTSSDRTALAAAVAYLLYFPMQFLDIEIDLKTFRPESFGIPLLLLTLDQLDRRSLAGTLIGIAACLTVKEDYAIVFGPLGVWIAFGQMTIADRQIAGQSIPDRFSSFKFRLISGMSLCVFSVAYLWLATRKIMPWFRSGAEVHFASYFARFGKTPEEILRTMVTHPGLLFDALVTADTAMYAIALLAPLAFLPLLSPSRLAVGLPLFCVLCLNELKGSRTPQHQFHAPLVAIIFWSLAAALPRAMALLGNACNRFGLNGNGVEQRNSAIVGNLVWTSALATGLFFSLSPLGLMFWDANSNWSWRQLYGPTHRAEMFARISDLIPQSARVASTDFIHPRYTHHERSYDYSDYQRKVSGEGKRIPDDTDYIVIDTDHRYSRIKLADEVPEFRDHPEQWELLPDKTEGCFIVLKRKK
jgi:uncharacterized membrane protein